MGFPDEAATGAFNDARAVPARCLRAIPPKAATTLRNLFEEKENAEINCRIAGTSAGRLAGVVNEGG
jgi:hypothetical protein